MMHELHLLLDRLADAGVDFVVSGGYAGVIHVSTLVTWDVDVCAVLPAENMERIREVLGDWHPFHRQTHRKLSFLDHPVPGVPLVNLYLKMEKGVIDILSSMVGTENLDRLRMKAVSMNIFGEIASVISNHGLIVNEEAVRREKDLLAVKELRAILAKRVMGDGGVGEA